ncbi:MAG: YfbK domain-containing protein [Paracoccaceae bacterium]
MSGAEVSNHIDVGGTANAGHFGTNICGKLHSVCADRTGRPVDKDLLTGLQFGCVAQDVKIQVEFNPAEIAEYRLIGYETRALNREDFNNNAVDAGEIGAGHTVTAIYEITPVGSPAMLVDDLRYATDEVDSLNAGEYAFLKLRYKNPGAETSMLISTPILPTSDAGLSREVEFAAAVAGFGQILRGDTLMHGLGHRRRAYSGRDQ